MIASNRGGTTLASSNLVGRVLPTYGAILEALVKLKHPADNRRAIRTLLRRRGYRTNFAAPSGGVLRVLWRTRVTIGKGRLRRHRTLTVATARRTYAGLGVGPVTVRQTRYGRTMLRRRPHGHLITATEGFEPLGGSWVTLVRRFTL